MSIRYPKYVEPDQLHMEMPQGAYNSNERIQKGIEKGRLTWDDVDAAAAHVLYGFGMAGY